jgi:hypothetical protein
MNDEARRVRTGSVRDPAAARAPSFRNARTEMRTMPERIRSSSSRSSNGRGNSSSRTSSGRSSSTTRSAGGARGASSRGGTHAQHVRAGRQSHKND